MSVKNIFLVIALVLCNLVAKAQMISVPYENFYTLRDFPKSSDGISFTFPRPFVKFKDSIPDKQTTYQCLVSIPPVSDSMLSVYVQYAMLSLTFEQKFCNYRKGTEIWYGVSKMDIPTFAGIYYKAFSDSTKLYVLTTYSLTAFNRKPKTDLSKTICDRIRMISTKHK